MSGDSSRRPEPLEAQEVQRLQRELAAINECPEAPDDMQELVDSDDESPGDERANFEQNRVYNISPNMSET